MRHRISMLDVMDTYEFRVRTHRRDPEVAKWGVGMKRTDVIEGFAGLEVCCGRTEGRSS